MNPESDCKHGNNAQWCVKCRIERENEKRFDEYEKARHDFEEDMRDG